MIKVSRAALFVAILPFALGCGGAAASSLAKAVHEVAPEYRPRAPASSDADLGRELRGGQPMTNACFDGDRSDGPPARSWSKVVVSYDDALGGVLKADLGDLIKVPASGDLKSSAKRRATVTLSNLTLAQLAGVFLNPRSACATDAATRAAFETPGGAFARVITRAMKAGTIDVEADSAIISKLSVNVGKAGGASPSASASTDQSSADKRTWSGVELYLADQTECFKITHEKQLCQGKPIGAGGACDIATCSFSVKSYDAATSKFTGALSCQGDDKPHEITEAVGTWTGSKTAPGVSYTARVTTGKGLNAVDIEIHLWNVLSVAAGACK